MTKSKRSLNGFTAACREEVRMIRAFGAIARWDAYQALCGRYQSAKGIMFLGLADCEADAMVSHLSELCGKPLIYMQVTK